MPTNRIPLGGLPTHRPHNRPNQPNPENNLREHLNQLFFEPPPVTNENRFLFHENNPRINEIIHQNAIPINEFINEVFPRQLPRDLRAANHFNRRLNNLLEGIQEEIHNHFAPIEGVRFENAFQINVDNLPNFIHIDIRLEAHIPADNEANAAPLHDPIDDFMGHRQNTHRSSVTTSVTESILKLKQRYVLGDDEEPSEGRIVLAEKKETIQAEIESFLVTSTLYHNPEESEVHNFEENNRRKSLVTQWFDQMEFLNYDTEIHAASELNLKEILSLIWHAASDKHTIPSDAGVPELSEEDIIARKTTLLKHIYESQRDHVCFVGNINSIVSSLDLCHPDIEIKRFSPEELAHFAKTTSQEHMFAFLKNSLSQLHPNRKALVLSDWDTEGPFSTEFMQTIRQDDSLTLRNFLREKLNENYGADVSDIAKTNIINEMIASLDDIPRTAVD